MALSWRPHRRQCDAGVGAASVDKRRGGASAKRAAIRRHTPRNGTGGAGIACLAASIRRRARQPPPGLYMNDAAAYENGVSIAHSATGLIHLVNLCAARRPA